MITVGTARSRPESSIASPGTSHAMASRAGATVTAAKARRGTRTLGAATTENLAAKPRREAATVTARWSSARPGAAGAGSRRRIRLTLSIQIMTIGGNQHQDHAERMPAPRTPTRHRLAAWEASPAGHGEIGGYASGVAGGSSAPLGPESGLADALGGGAALFLLAAAPGVGRRIDTRVTARITASASATSPTTCAPAVEPPAGAAKVLATCSVCPVREGRGETGDCRLDCELLDCGLTVGNSPEALPAALGTDDDGDGDDGDDSGRVGRASAVVPAGVGATAAGVGDTAAGVGATAAGAGGARMVMASDTSGCVPRLAALPVAVRLADVTVDAVAGTTICACSSRIVAVASTAPRSQEAVPSP